MERIEPFRSLGEVQRHRDMLRGRRAGHASGIRTHWNTLGDAEFRSAVVNGAARSIWKAWQPLQTLRATVLEPGDLTGTLLGMALGSRSRTMWGRLVIWAAGAAMPTLLEQLKGNDRVRHLLAELERSWQRIREHWRERREARKEHSE